MLTNKKQPYVPPELDVFLYTVEKGFAETPVKVRAETFSEINDDGTSATGGENYTGQWGNTEW